MRTLAIIPARAGSKGIPGKNIKVLGGKPLIAYTIESALNSKAEMDVVVNTDGEEIAKVAQEFGANVPFLRPAHLAADHSPAIDYVLHTIEWFENKGEHYDNIVLLQPTSPFREQGFVDKCVEQFQSQGFDSLISVLPVPHEYNPHWVFEADETGELKIATGEESLIPRRQELPKAYHRDGSVYIATTKLIKEISGLVGGKVGYVESNPLFYCNLDTMKDWEKAEAMIEPYVQGTIATS